MADLLVRQNGTGDYLTLDEAFDNATAGNDIEMDQSWTIDDTREAVCAVDCQVTTSGTARHSGYYDTTENHYRLVGNGSDALTIGEYTVTIDGIVIEQEGTGSSDEACDVRPGTSDSVTISNCIVLCSTNTAYQDCIYTGYNQSIGTVDVVQCMLYGANRGGINIQNSDNQGTAYAAIINVNSCTIWGNGLATAAGNGGAGGIVFIENGNGPNIDIFVHNVINVGNTTGTGAADYYEDTANDAVWDIAYSCDSDNSINAVLGADGTGNLKNRVPLDTTASGASEVLFEDLTTIDLRLQDNDTYNTAQDAHSVQTDAGMTIPDNDIVGTSRNSAGTPQQGTDFDIGAFEIVAGGGGFAGSSRILGGGILA